MRYLVVMEKSSTGWSAYLPDMPGCVATGATPEETEANIRDAIALHLEGMAEDGVQPTPPQTLAIWQEVAV